MVRVKVWQRQSKDPRGVSVSVRVSSARKWGVPVTARAARGAPRLTLGGLGGQLTMDKLHVSGQLTTTPDDPKAVVTDSAAAATAWASGEKSYNGASRVDAE